MAISTGAAILGGAVLSGVLGSRSAGQAASAQADAAAQANDQQRAMYDQTRADNAPFRQIGLEANNKLAEMMRAGQFDRRFTQQDLNADPVYQNGLQFGLDQGTQGINRQAAAGGSFLSGATLKALSRYGNDYGSTKANESYNRFNTDQTNRYNRYAGLAGTGQQATNQVSAAGQNMANQVGQGMMDAGNARASGYMGQANALAGAIGQGYNNYQQNRMLDMFSSNQPQSYSMEVPRMQPVNYGLR